MSFVEFLNYAMGTGINAIVGFILSFIVDYLPWYNNLLPKQARLVFIGLSFVIPGLALLAGLATNEFVFVDFQTTIWPVLLAGFTAAFAGTLAHTRKL